MLNPKAQGDDLEVELLGEDWLGHEAGALVNGIGALIKEMLENSLTPSALWRYTEKMAAYEPGNGLSPDT